MSLMPDGTCPKSFIIRRVHRRQKAFVRGGEPWTVIGSACSLLHCDKPMQFVATSIGKARQVYFYSTWTIQSALHENIKSITESKKYNKKKQKKIKSKENNELKQLKTNNSLDKLRYSSDFKHRHRRK